MLPAALDLLACPHCGGPLDQVAPGVIGCFSGHRFDVARQGYLTLLGPRARTDTADDAAMVAARGSFLGAGHFAPIANAVAAAVSGDGAILDIGAGTGYYLAAVVDPQPDRVGVALDASRFAARRAAHRHPRIGAVVADGWSRLPIRDAAMGTVLSIFAPRNVVEIGRVLEPGGRLIAVTPDPAHLAEIRDLLGMLAVDDGKADKLAGEFRLVGSEQLRFPLALSGADAVNLVRMGPAARHRTAEETAAAVAALPEPITATAAVTISALAAD